MADKIARSHLKKYQTVVIGNWVDPDIFRPRARTGNTAQKIVIAVANKWGEIKGLPECFALAKAMPSDWRLMLVGLDKTQQKTYRELNIYIYNRTKSERELARLYNTADVLFNPSAGESFSLVTLEAMTCGLPVVARDDTAVEELLAGGAGVCCRNKLGDYILAIERVINNPAYSQAAVNTARKYTKKEQLDKYISLYKGSE
jgi:glycosyltransferase involved in cell wall biosynthesis